MPIRISEGSERFFASRHFIAYSLGGGQYTIVRSGLVLLPNESSQEASQGGRPWDPTGFQGTSTSNWRAEELTLILRLGAAINRLNPGTPTAGNMWAFHMEQWAPIASLNSIFNAGTSNNAGTRVREFSLTQPGGPAASVELTMDIGVRDTDGVLFRVGYYITLVGRLVQIQAPNP
jgi:hypothetical protein